MKKFAIIFSMLFSGILFAHADIENQPKSINVGDIVFNMLPVDGGTFQMGYAEGQKDVQPVHYVTLDVLYIGETEVTQGLWKTVMGENPSYFKGDDLPEESVTLADCHNFINKLNELTGLNFRLPTEAEWEYAARGGRKSQDTKLSGSDDVCEVAWIDNADSTQNVAQLKPNELGIYDMSGNVCEWIEEHIWRLQL